MREQILIIRAVGSGKGAVRICGTRTAITSSERCIRVLSLGLTARESEITRLMLDDASKTQIAKQLSISPFTVNAHLSHVRAKLGIHGRDQLVLRVFSSYLSSCAKVNR